MRKRNGSIFLGGLFVLFFLFWSSAAYAALDIESVLFSKTSDTGPWFIPVSPNVLNVCAGDTLWIKVDVKRGTGSTSGTRTNWDSTTLSYRYGGSGFTLIRCDNNPSFISVPASPSVTYTFSIIIPEPPAGYSSPQELDISVAINNLNGCANEDDKWDINDRVAVLPPPDATITPSVSSVCAGTTNLTASVADAGVGATYAWTVTGGSITGGQGTREITWTAGGAGTAEISVTVTNAAGCSGEQGSVNVTVNALPGTPTSLLATPSTICAGSSSTLSATVGAGETVDWYTGSCGGALAGTGSPSVSPVTTTTYYARARNTTTGCISAACAEVTVTVNALPGTPTSLLATPSAICAGSSSTLSATVGAGETVDWYRVSCGGTLVRAGSSITVSPVVTTTYYAQARNTTTGCISAACAEVTVTVNALPETPTSLLATPSAICIGSSSTLSATVGAGETVDWYTESCGGTSAGTGSPSVSPAATTTYYARARNTTTGCVSAACAEVTVTVNALPGTPTSLLATPSAICIGSSSTLSATVGAGETVDWYTGSCGGTLAGTGSPSVSPATTTTYYARARNTTTGCISAACAEVTVTVNPLPGTPTSLLATPSTICAGSSSTLSATVGAGETVDWYTGSCGGTLAGTGSPSVSPATTTTYYARARNTTTGCVSTVCAEVTVTVNASVAVPTGLLATPSTICAGSSSTLSATVGAGETVDWYTESCGGTLVGSGSPSVSPATTTTYYARARNTTTGCVSVTCGEVTVTVNASVAVPTSLLATPSAICIGGSSTLSATVGAGETVDWYTGSCGGTLVGSGSPSVSPAATTTYYARARNTTTGCISAACAEVTVTVSALPGTPTSLLATPPTICAGNSSTLSATVGAGETVDWYTESCGGTLAGTGSPSVSPATTTTYYARARNTTTGCVSTACAEVTVTVNASVAVPTGLLATPPTICAGNSSTLSATVGAGETVDWYTGSCGGTLAGTGSPSVSPTTTTTYYARARNTTTGCVSVTCGEVTVTVNAIVALPTSLLATPSAICLGSSSTLSATVGAGETVDWYTGSCGGTLVGSGSPSVSPSTTTTYYARARNTTTGCISAACATVTLTVNPLPLCTITAPATVVTGSTGNTASTVDTPGATYDWVLYVDEVLHNELITSPAPQGSTITWSAPDSFTEIKIGVTVTSAEGCVCENDPPINPEDPPGGATVLPKANASIPTLSEWGMMILGLLMAGTAVIYLKRRNDMTA